MTDTAPEAPITHPEETRGDFDLRVGKNINFKGSGRVTPAGIVTVELMTIGILLATTALIRAARREPHPSSTYVANGLDLASVGGVRAMAIAPWCDRRRRG